MQGKAQILDLLNQLLTGELTAAHQFIAHSKLCKHMGYERLAVKLDGEAHEELGHAGLYIERILFLGGTPDMQSLQPLTINATVKGQFDADLVIEMEAVSRLNAGIALARQVGDNGTEALLTKILVSEEEHVLWIEKQQRTIADIGIQNYLTEQIKP
jgi:bacterioferritin